MAPRKKPNNVENTNAATTPKAQKQIKKINRKNPAVGTVKKPPQKPVERQVRKRTTKKSINFERNIELANEVAKLQLTKKNSIVVSFKNDIKIEPVNKPAPRQVNTNRKSKRGMPSLEPEAESNDKKPAVNGIAPKTVKTTDGLTEKKPAPKKRPPEPKRPTPKRNIVKKTADRPKIARNNNITRYLKLTITKKNNVGKEDVLSKVVSDHAEAGGEAAQSAVEPQAPSVVETRKVSVASSSNLSWTKDVSSSNTTISARIDDIVRIDNKMPIVRLTKLGDGIKQEKCDSDATSSTSSSTDESKIDVANDLNLSMTSDSTIAEEAADKNDNEAKKTEVRDELRKAFDKLSSSLKKFDIEIMKWIGHTSDDTKVSFQNKILKVLKEESDVLNNCRCIKNHLRGVTNDTEETLDRQGDGSKHNDEVDFVRPADVSRKVPDDLENTRRNLSNKSGNCMLNQNSALSPPLVSKPMQSSNEDNVRLSVGGYNYEDDDAISLFAESISGMELSQFNSSIAVNGTVDNEEEYIPRPISENESPDKFTYFPTKITNGQAETSKKTICERHNADSTSVGKDFYDALAETAMANFEDDYQESAKDMEPFRGPAKFVKNRDTLSLMASKNKPMHARNSVLFKNVCFYNTLGHCKNLMCRFPHVIPDVLDVKRLLATLHESIFIREYMILRDYSNLRRKYGFCFVEECRKRQLTRTLVEMAIDFITKATHGNKDDSDLKLSVLEYVLMYLNHVDLEGYGDLLKCKVAPSVQLCDVLMLTIATTQNFSRFKPVFLNLTSFMVANDMGFGEEVANHVLERVCILPNEDPLSRAVLDILKRTDASIFQSNMAAQFEKQLGAFNKNLLEEYLSARTRAGSRQVAQFDRGMESLTVMCPRSDTSPDTTNVETKLNSLEPAVTAPTDSNYPRFNQYSSSRNSSVGEWPKHFQKWGRPSPRAPPPLMSLFNAPVRPPVRPPRRQVMYRPPTRPHHPSYQRRCARDF